MLGVLTEKRPPCAWVATVLLVLCSAYILGGLAKLSDWSGAVAETAQLGLPLPPLLTVATIAIELLAPILVVSGWNRRLGAAWLAAFTLMAALVANRFWILPPGPKRFQQFNGFFEHLGLVAAFVFVGFYSYLNRTTSQ